MKNIKKLNKANLQRGLGIEFLICVILTLCILVLAPNIEERGLFLSTLFGGLLAVFVGTVVIVPIQYIMRWRADIPWDDKGPKTTNILGYIERAFIFIACAIHNGPIIIAGWIALKSISHWKGWDESKDNQTNFNPGRARFNIFLVGTALSIMAAIAGALYSVWLYNPCKLIEIFTFGVLSKRS